VGNWMRLTQPITQPKRIKAHYIGRKEYQLGYWAEEKYTAYVHLAPVSPKPVIRCAQENNARILYCSSGAAYDQNTDYADAKREGESECLKSGLDVVIARLFTFFGEGLDAGKAYSQFERCAQVNEPLIVMGSGNAVRTYMHGSELGSVMWRLLERGLRGEIYDVGSDEETTILELAKKIVRENNSKSEISVLGGSDRVPYYVPNNLNKTRELL
jgi:nucleoside-diphosphate-sugar epimerase